MGKDWVEKWVGTVHEQQADGHSEVSKDAMETWGALTHHGIQQA